MLSRFLQGLLTCLLLMAAVISIGRREGDIILLKRDWGLTPEEGNEALRDYLNKRLATVSEAEINRVKEQRWTEPWRRGGYWK